MSRKKPIVALLHYYCPPVIGGVEVVIEAHAKLLADAGYPTRMIVGAGGSPHPKSKLVIIPEIVARGGPLAKELEELAAAKVPKNFDRCVSRVQKKLEVALRGADVCFMHNVLTMHFNLILAAALANIMAKKGRTRFISWTHDLSFADPRYKKFCKNSYPWDLMKTKLEGCEYCVISKQRQDFTNRIMGIPKSRIPVVPDGISIPGFLEITPRVRAVFEKERLYDVDVVAVTPARLLPRKRLEFGVEVVAALKRKGVSVRWLVTGAPDACNIGGYQGQILKLINKLNVKKEVVFVGADKGKLVWVSDEDVHSLYAVSDVLIFASQQEGFGIPILEAGLARNLLVLSGIPVLKEICGKDSGCDVVWVPEKGRKRAGGLESMGTKKADSVARQIVQKLGKSAQVAFRKTVMRRYSWDMILKTHIMPMIHKPKK